MARLVRWPATARMAGFVRGPWGDRWSLRYAWVGAILPVMPSVQIKDVPADVHAVLRRRAAAAGQSLQEYLLARLTEQARTDTLDEVLDRAGGRSGGSVPFRAAVAAVRADRDDR